MPRRRRPPALRERSLPTSPTELLVERPAAGGVFVAHYEGKVVFLPETAPGERVLARFVEDHTSFLRAVPLEVLAASPHRRPHVWSAAGIDRPPAERAGGADLGHLDLAYQRLLKAQMLEEALRRIGRLPDTVDTTVEPVGEGDVRDRGTGWRTRVRLHVDGDGRTGPLSARSHRVVEVEDLPLADPRLQNLDEHRRRHPGARTVDLVLADDGPVVLVDERPEVTVSRSVGSIVLEGSAGGFWQVHRDAPTVLTRAVREACAGFDPDADNLDLYGGVGLFASALAGQGARVTSVESDSSSSRHAQANLRRWPDAAAVHSSVLAFLTGWRASAAERRAAAVVLDPPRSGAGAQVVAAIVSHAPSRIVYVACDPVSFARDAGDLVRSGYRMASLRAFDLYPNSHHLETVALFLREEAPLH